MLNEIPVTDWLELTLVRVTFCELLLPTLCWPNDSDVGDNCTMVPTPLSATVCGLPVALSLMETLAVRLPRSFGVKVTLIVHVAPAARVVPHVLVWA